jgi:hypothetical protein
MEAGMPTLESRHFFDMTNDEEWIALFLNNSEIPGSRQYLTGLDTNGEAYESQFNKIEEFTQERFGDDLEWSDPNVIRTSAFWERRLKAEIMY